MRVAVVGAGLFGCTAAIFAARAGHDVHLLEAKDGLFFGASGINHARLHKGYHYPRSNLTLRECRASLSSFIDEYGAAVVAEPQARYYAIARHGSMTSPEAFVAFMTENDLEFTEVPAQSKALAFQCAVYEDRIDLGLLANLVASDMKAEGVTVHYGAEAGGELRDEFDQIVLCAYARNPEIAARLGCEAHPIEFRYHEMVLVKLPARYRSTCSIVLDGPFACCDAYGSTGLHAVSHVTESVHAKNVGLTPEIPVGAVSKARHILEVSAPYLPQLDKAVYQRSMFTVRAVLPGLEGSDARPTLVERLDSQTIRVFSGKIGTAVEAAKRTVRMLECKSVDKSTAEEAA